MRIVSGIHRGRNITAPSGKGTRPTSDQTRESIFNILAHADWCAPLDGAITADIFAGSGALGLEAVSRGAAFCLFVETEPKARAAIRENVDTFGLGGITRLHRRDAVHLKIAPGNLRGPFTHVFMDPPYKKGLGLPVLAKLAEHKLLAPDAAIIFEMSAEEEFEPRGYDIMVDRTWGAARVVFMRVKK